MMFSFGYMNHFPPNSHLRFLSNSNKHHHYTEKRWYEKVIEPHAGLLIASGYYHLPDTFKVR
jgi:hypothetical protein